MVKFFSMSSGGSKEEARKRTEVRAGRRWSGKVAVVGKGLWLTIRN